MKHKHKCGCVTEDYKDGVRFIKMCEKHRENKSFSWVAMQHPRGDK